MANTAILTSSSTATPRPTMRNFTQDSSIVSTRMVDITVQGQHPYMSDSGGGASTGIFVGAGVGGCALLVGIVAIVIYCYMKARKEKAGTNMTKSNDIFTTAASNTHTDLPRKSRVNYNPDPQVGRRSRRDQGRDSGHANPAFIRHSSDSSSVGSDVDGRDLSPPRVRKTRGGETNAAFYSDSYEDSSSVEDDIVEGSYTLDNEINREKKGRRSYKMATKQDDSFDGAKKTANGRYHGSEEESRRISRRDEFTRNPRSDSPLTIETLEKHEKNTRRASKDWDDPKATVKSNKSRRRDQSPSSRTYESSEVTHASLTTAGTDFTATTASTTRFAKNPSLRRNSPARSSSHRRYKKDNEKDDKGRRKPRRTRSSDRDRSSSGRSDRSRSPGSSSSRSGSGSTRRSRSSSAREAKQINKQQAILPIFQQTSKKNSAV